MSDIIKRPDSSLAMPVEENFWENMNEKRDRKFPIVKLGQGTSSGNIKPGEYNWNSGKHVPEIVDCQMLFAKKGRTLFDGLGARPSLCGSKNFTEPSPRYKEPFAKNCYRCPLSQWETNDMKVKVVKQIQAHSSRYNPNITNKPLCAPKHEFLIYSREHGIFWIAFFSTSIKIVTEKLVSRLRNEYPGVVPYGVSFSMGVEHPSGVFYPTFSDFKVLPMEEILATKAQRDEVVRQAEQDLEDQLAELDQQNQANVRDVFPGDDEPPF